MTQSDILENLIQTAERDMEAAKTLLASGHNTWCLFMWHLVIEKMLKAILIKHGKQIIYTHNLTLLYKNTELDLGNETLDLLSEINRFNIEARYDFEKAEFYKIATVEYTEKWVNICEELFAKLSKYVQ